MGKLFFPRSEDSVPLYLLCGTVREGSRQAGANVDIPLGKRNLDAGHIGDDLGQEVGVGDDQFDLVAGFGGGAANADSLDRPGIVVHWHDVATNLNGWLKRQVEAADNTIGQFLLTGAP